MTRSRVRFRRRSARAESRARRRSDRQRAIRGRSGVGLQHASADLVELDALEQGLEVAFAESFVALALDDLEEDRADHFLGEDLQQQFVRRALMRGAVDQDAQAAQLVEVLVVFGQALGDQVVVGLIVSWKTTPVSFMPSTVR